LLDTRNRASILRSSLEPQTLTDPLGEPEPAGLRQHQREHSRSTMSPIQALEEALPVLEALHAFTSINLESSLEAAGISDDDIEGALDAVRYALTN